jgi:hypothetical protein
LLLAEGSNSRIFFAIFGLQFNLLYGKLADEVVKFRHVKDMRDETSIRTLEPKPAATLASFLIYRTGIKNPSNWHKTKEKTFSNLR